MVIILFCMLLFGVVDIYGFERLSITDEFVTLKRGELFMNYSKVYHSTNITDRYLFIRISSLLICFLYFLPPRVDRVRTFIKYVSVIVAQVGCYVLSHFSI
ncbi:hypothetical protein D0Y65_021849 [Glycine soja]|uniref:Uncharacterized protein n=1 Tax=Glycine soja TaxID=3848 RepID=A0A445JKV6_GLYSO|nr:hypothetical protein D0Y65_021849 [Glycine soja]